MKFAGILWHSPDRNQHLIKTLKGRLGHHYTSTEKEFCSLFWNQFEPNSQVKDLHHSLLIGSIFPKLHGKQPENIELQKALEKGLDAFTNSFWGNYICISSVQAAETLSVLRDPTGQLPFYYHCLQEGPMIFASAIEILRTILPSEPGIDWDQLASFIKYGSSFSHDTPFVGIHELKPGYSLDVSSRKTQQYLAWDPLQKYYQAPKPEDRDELLIDTLCHSLKAGISPYKEVVLSLSGGLDSTAILFCLKKVIGSGQKLRAITMFHPEVRSSSELVYARQACQETGVELIEFDTSQHLPLTHVEKLLPTKPDKPAPILTHIHYNRTISDYLGLNASSLFMSGQGGDHIFLCPPPVSTVSDYILENGFKGAAQKLQEISMYYRMPLYPVLRETISCLWRYTFSKYPRSHDTLSPSWLIKDAESKFHCYDPKPNRILPGKFAQINALYEAIVSISSDILKTFHPLLSQPMMELAMSIPTYDLYAQGYNRYPFRRAISRSFNTQTVWRKDKGNTTGVFQNGLKQNLKEVLALCLEGHCVRQGIVKPDPLHKHIKIIAGGQNDCLWPLIHLISTEIYLRHWE